LNQAPKPQAPSRYLAQALDEAMANVAPVQSRGRVLEALGTLVRATGVAAPIGQLCELVNSKDAWRVRAQVIGIAHDSVLLTPFGDLAGLSAQTEVVNLGCAPSVRVSAGLLGRVLNGFGEPIDGQGPLAAGVEMPVFATAPPALTRRPITHALQTGVRAASGWASSRRPAPARAACCR
jgi:ATP synthase in type III secretion protein N